MEAKAKERSIELGRVATDPFLKKLTSTPTPDRDEPYRSKLRGSIAACASSGKTCWAFLVDWTKKYGTLSLFHMLNVVVTIFGIVLVLMMLVVTALTPCWLVVAAYGLLVFGIAQCIEKFVKRDWLKWVMGFLALGLWYWSLFYKYTLIVLTLVPSYACTVASIQFLIYGLSYVISPLLIVSDVQLSQFVDPVIASTAPTGVTTLDGKECVERFTFPLGSDDETEEELIPWHERARRICVLVSYYAVFKVAVGAMSATALLLVLIQPIAAICTLGNDPFIGKLVDSQTHGVIYVVAVAFLWVFGVIGLQVAASLSVKLVVLVYSPSEAKKPTTEVEIDPDVPPTTPEQEPTNTSFTQI